MANKESIIYYFILVLIFTILILLFNEPHEINETFNNHRYNWRDYYNLRYNNNLHYNNNLSPKYNIFYNLPLFRYLENRDRSILYDPLIAPERRTQYPLYNNLLNYPTRGFPEKYQQLGIVTRNNDEKILQLFGRPTFPRSNQWEYYVIGGKDGFVNKIPIQSKNQKELEDGDEIDVIGMNSNNGKFIVKLFNYNVPRYNPYDY